MPIRYRCPQCKQLLSVATRKGGHPSKCPTCGAVHVIPVPKQQPGQIAEAPVEAVTPAEAAVRVTSKTKPAPVLAPSLATPTASLQTNAESMPSTPFAVGGSEIAIHDDRGLNWRDDEEDEGLAIQPIERKSDELDLIPMVDCVFLLLVFYMITASYALQKTISFAPPAPDKKGALQAAPSPEDMPQSSVVVQIDARNRILVDDVPLASVSDLPDVLRAKLNGEQKNELVIEADPQALHETEVAVVDAANELEFQHVRMAVTAQDAD